MIDRLLLCTDLDRTLLPNGPHSESKQARQHFRGFVDRPQVSLAYVSGRHRELVQQAIIHYGLPVPDFVVGDVGTTIYVVGKEQKWERQTGWEQEIAADWKGLTATDVKRLINLSELRLQERSKQNLYKVSYYVPLHADREALSTKIRQQLATADIRASLVWSTDEPAGIGLLDILPERATKFHAIEALIRDNGFSLANTVFAGDSGNDIEALVSPIPAVLVANSQPQVRQISLAMAEANGQADRLYIANGGLLGMNGNYAAGILEGVVHYHPETISWLTTEHT